ncbi:MAG: LuxR C-terminal-related transcriptional regulator [Oceanicaulis sp.]|nr:LuxR C-terminal-related transcriptional regulator [Oceanicaulis sp.]
MTPDSVSKLIADIYDGVLEPALWTKALREFVTLSGGRFAFFAIIDSSAGTLPASSVAGPETSRLDDALNVHRELVPIDPGLPYALARPQGGVFRFSDTSRAWTEEPQAWREFIRHDLGSGDYHSRFSAERDGVSLVLALHTPAAQKVMTPEQEALHAIIFDHFQRASRLAFRLPDLSHARRPMILVDRQGLILGASPAGEVILSDNDGLTVAQGRLRATGPANDQTLQTLIRQACSGGFNRGAEQYCAISRPTGARSHILRLGPMPLPDLGMKGAAYRCLVEILGAEGAGALTPDQLRTLFGLTLREAEIAALLAAAFNDLRSVAAHLSMSHETARVHIRSIFSKVGVTNQVELVRALAQLQ